MANKHVTIPICLSVYHECVVGASP